MPKMSEMQDTTLSKYGIDRQQAADLRHRLATFAEDWERPEMDVYDSDDDSPQAGSSAEQSES